MIRCDDIFLQFGNKILFENWSTHIQKGENVCINGISGRGKSTLLQILQGNTLVDKGEVCINGLQIDPKNIQAIRKLITWIPQNIHLPVKNVKELISFMDMYISFSEVEDFANLLGIDNYTLEQDFSDISGGQKQRMIIAVCLSLDTPIILMDEPTSSLDQEAIALFIKTIKTLKGKTIVSASHNTTWLNSVDRIIKL